MYILINAKKVNENENEEICFLIKGDRNEGYQVEDKDGKFVNPSFADIGVDIEHYYEVKNEVFKPGTKILWLKKDEVCYMATENYWIRCHALSIKEDD